MRNVNINLQQIVSVKKFQNTPAITVNSESPGADSVFPLIPRVLYRYFLVVLDVSEPLRGDTRQRIGVLLPKVVGSPSADVQPRAHILGSTPQIQGIGVCNNDKVSHTLVIPRN